MPPHTHFAGGGSFPAERLRDLPCWRGGAAGCLRWALPIPFCSGETRGALLPGCFTTEQCAEGGGSSHQPQDGKHGGLPHPEDFGGEWALGLLGGGGGEGPGGSCLSLVQMGAMKKMKFFSVGGGGVRCENGPVSSFPSASLFLLLQRGWSLGVKAPPISLGSFPGL